MPFSKHGYPRPLILKSGEEVWLRPVRPEEDDKEVFAFLGRLSAEDRWYLDFDANDPETVRYNFIDYNPNKILPVVATNANQVLVAVVVFTVAGALPVLFPWALGFAAGALIYLLLVELLPESYHQAGHTSIALVALLAMAMVVSLGGNG